MSVDTAIAVSDRVAKDRSKDGMLAIILVSVLALALVLRVLYLINQGSMAIPVRHPDTFLYDMLARNVLSGKGYVGEDYLIAQKGAATAFYGPIYPLFVAAIYRLVGYSFLYVQVAQILISVIACYLVYATGALLFGRRAGMLAAGLFAVYPELVGYPSAVLSETLFVFLEILFVYFAVRALADDEPGIAAFALVGGAFALAYLCRQVVTAAPLLLLPLAWYRFRGKGWRWFTSRSLVFALVALVMIAPWSIRNYRAMGTLSPATTTGGVTFWWGNNTDRRRMDLPTALEEVKKVNPGLSEMEMNSLLYKLGFENLSKKGPLELAELLWGKWRKMWMPYVFNWSSTRALALLQYVVIYALLIPGLIGAVVHVRRSPGILALTAVLFSGIAANLATIGNARYGVPFMPLLMIAAVPFWMSVTQKVLSAHRRDR